MSVSNSDKKTSFKAYFYDKNTLFIFFCIFM